MSFYVKETIRKSAFSMGASDVAIISSADILVEEELANLCNGDPRCENYALAPSCPPHVSGPTGFRKLQIQSRQAVIVRVDVPSTVLFSSARRQVMQLLHEIVSEIEQIAVENGFKEAKAFAGGSCKNIFCHEHIQCRKLSEQAQCRHPEKARPSMSGFGINVAQLFKTAHWDLKVSALEDVANPESMSWVAGLVLF